MAGKSPEAGLSGDLKAFYAICDADDEILPDIEEEMVEKVMHELLNELNGTGPVPSSFSSSSGFEIGESCGPAFPGSGSTVMAGIEMSGGGTAADITIGGGVGVLVGPIKGVISGFVDVGFPAEASGGNGPSCAVPADGKGKVKRCSMQGGGKEEEMMDGCDEEMDSDDDEWLTMFLNYAPPELDEWL